MIVSILILFGFSAFGQFCKTIDAPRRNLRNQALSKTIERNSSWDAIRFYVDWSQFSTDEKQKYEKYIDAAFVYFSNALKVHQITSSSTWDEFLIDDEYCSLLYDKYLGKVIHSTEMLVLLTLEYNSEETYAGYSVVCGMDPETNQPIATTITLNKANIGTGKNEVEKLVMLITHELAHSLGFSYEDMSNFIKPDGSNYSKSELFTTLEVRGLTKQIFLSTPKVQELARESFGCSTLPGIQLENQGLEGSVHQHWDKRIMGTEYMNPQMLRSGIVYSDITLAVFEDSGWYQPDYSYGTKINFGYNKGCDFIENKCIIDEQPISEEFCADASLMLCDFSHLSYGFCKFVESSGIPTEFQYFSDETLGGDFYADYCPVNLRTFGCRGNSFVANSDLGESFCLDCRCVEGTFSLSEADVYRASCHEITCYGESFDVKIGNSTVTCNADGEELDVEGFLGTMVCPSFEKVCSIKPCRFNCFGGKCESGVCSNGGDENEFGGEEYPDYGGNDQESFESESSETLESSSFESSESYFNSSESSQASILYFCLANLFIGA